MIRQYLVVVLLLVGFLGVFISCTSSEEVTDATPVEEDVSEEEIDEMDVSEDEPTLDEKQEEVAKEDRADVSPDSVTMVFDRRSIHFEYDKSDILSEYEKSLEKKAQYLAANPQQKIQIEGHCDERGSNQYNLALGERRAHSTKVYLIGLGVKPDQLDTISYGEEKPIDPQSNEEAWAKNRRSEFLQVN